MWVTYKPNPHNVKAEQLPIIVNDPNSPDNTELEDEYPVQHNVASAIKELFDRVNLAEDEKGAIINLVGTAQDLQDLDMLDGIEGNSSPTLIGLAINNKQRLDDIDTLDDEDIDDLVGTYFNLNGGTQEAAAGEGEDSGDGPDLGG